MFADALATTRYQQRPVPGLMAIQRALPTMSLLNLRAEHRQSNNPRPAQLQDILPPRSLMGVAWYESAWTIATITIVLTYLATPLLDGAVGWLRSRRGALTGTYLALTNQNGVLVVERATCWQVGNGLRGHIDGVLTAQPLEGQVYSYSRITSAQYKFAGKRIADVVAVTYWDRSRSRAAGSVTLHARSSHDQILLGGWAGVVRFDVARAPCMWIRVKSGDFPLDDIDAFLTAVNCALEVVEPLRLLGYSGASLEQPEPWVIKGAEPDYPSRISKCIADMRSCGSRPDSDA